MTKKSGQIDLENACRKLGLPLAAIKVHAERIRMALAGESVPTFAIENTCKRDNGGVFSPAFAGQKSLLGSTEHQLRVVAFVPAAGAASRFLEPLKAMANNPAASSASCDWPLPPLLRKWLDSQDHEFSSEETSSFFLEMMSWPKALFPCNRNGVSFLDAKIREHRAYKMAGVNFCGEVYVVPVGRTDQFAKPAAEIPYEVIEQDASLSTLRFRRDGSFVVGSDGRPAVVPAGHGALTGLFGRVRKRFPEGDYLLIRNIDNVCGTSAETSIEVLRFCDFASAIIKAVRVIRAGLAMGQVEAPGMLDAASYLGGLAGHSGPEPFDLLRLLAAIQETLFHSAAILWSSEKANRGELISQLSQQYSRPVNVLGQVGNSGRDVGGTPVFVRRTDGVLEKLCIEVVHVNSEQVESVLKNPEIATHFNPVFVASELVDDFSAYDVDHPYWSCVQKRFEGEDVFYHESFLFEIIGSSAISNVVFVEIPRLLFNPHKTLSDTAAATVVV